jgi:predicted DNA-binding protein (UPF0251 family)
MATAESDEVWQAVVSSLDPLERRALTMIYIDGLTQRQIAQRLRLQRAAVSIAVARAMRVIAASVETPILVVNSAPYEDPDSQSGDTSLCDVSASSVSSAQ